mgnify:CR=1 FL=1
MGFENSQNDADYLDNLDRKNALDGRSVVNVNPELASVNQFVATADRTLAEYYDRYRDYMSRFWQHLQPDAVKENRGKRTDAALVENYEKQYNDTHDLIQKYHTIVGYLHGEASMFKRYGAEYINKNGNVKVKYENWKMRYKTLLKDLLDSNYDIDGMLYDLDDKFAELDFKVADDGISVVDLREERLKTARSKELLDPWG